MKRILILQTIVIFSGVLSLLVCIVKLPYLLILPMAIISLFLGGFIFTGLIKQGQLMEFMIAESRQKAENLPNWETQEVEQLDLLKKRVELSTLQNQINPHFLYNTLDSIRSHALLEGQNEIAAMTEKLSKFFRYCISSEGGLVKIREEINHIKDYYYIQKYRFEERFDMVIQVEEDDIYNLYIPRMSLQPLIENSIAHGLEKVSRKGHVVLSLEKTNTKVIIKVADNGIGMSLVHLDRLNERLINNQIEVSSHKEKHNGIALMNVNSRIKLIFGSEYGIHYRSIENIGTDAEVIIPLIDDFQRVQYEHSLLIRK